MSSDAQLEALLQAMLQQQAAMLELQRVLVERVIGAAPVDPPAIEPPAAEPPAAEPPAIEPRTLEPPRGVTHPVEAQASARGVDPPATRGARYYASTTPIPSALSITPEALELRRRLQELRSAGDLILQFGRHKGTTLTQVALHDPDYLRELMTRAARPAVRAAAVQLVAALDAAAEHQRSVSSLNPPGSRARRSTGRR